MFGLRAIWKLNRKYFCTKELIPGNGVKSSITVSEDSSHGGPGGPGGGPAAEGDLSVGGGVKKDKKKTTLFPKSKKLQKVVAFGNVLLDYTAHLKNTEILERYKLVLNSRNELDVETLTQITNETLGSEEARKPHLGGGALNMVRIIKKLGTEPLFFGAIGNEKHAELPIQQLLLNSGLSDKNFRLQEINDMPTGRCICLTYEENTALYANVGASIKFSKDFLIKVETEETPNFLSNLETDKQIYYIEGFFIPQREDVLTHIVSNYIEGRRYLALNLSANYIVKFNYLHIVYLAHYATFIIGNADEFDIFRLMWGANSLGEFAEAMLQNGTSPKILIITDGEKGGQVITNYVNEQEPPGEVITITYKSLPVEKLVDPVGCGDAFAAAFLHSWLQGRSMNECTDKAKEVSAKVAGQIGGNLP